MFATNANPTKIFKTPGVHTTRVTVTDNDGNTAIRSLPITVAAVALGIPAFAGGRFQFEVLGATNYDFVVQRSEGLLNWFSFATNRGPFAVTETNVTAAQRFYRVLVQP